MNAKTIKDLLTKFSSLVKLFGYDTDRARMQAAVGKRAELESLREEAAEYREYVRQQVAAGKLNQADYEVADNQVTAIGSALSRIDNEYRDRLINTCPDESLRLRHRELRDENSNLNRQIEELQRDYLTKSEALHKAQKAADACCLPADREREQVKVAGIRRELTENDARLATAKQTRIDNASALEECRAAMAAA